MNQGNNFREHYSKLDFCDDLIYIRYFKTLIF